MFHCDWNRNLVNTLFPAFRTSNLCTWWIGSGKVVYKSGCCQTRRAWCIVQPRQTCLFYFIFLYFSFIFFSSRTAHAIIIKLSSFHFFSDQLYHDFFSSHFYVLGFLQPATLLNITRLISCIIWLLPTWLCGPYSDFNNFQKSDNFNRLYMDDNKLCQCPTGKTVKHNNTHLHSLDSRWMLNYVNCTKITMKVCFFLFIFFSNRFYSFHIVLWPGLSEDKAQEQPHDDFLQLLVEMNDKTE